MRPRHAIPVLAFFALLCIPTVQAVFAPIPLPAADENRKLAPAPDFMRQNLHTALVATKRWIEDRYGFRSLLIQMKTQIDYSLFDTSARLHLGKDGFLFYRSVLDDERFVVDSYLRAYMTDVLTGVVRLRDELARRDKHLIVLVSPSKEMLYPDKLPAHTPRMPAPSQVEVLRAGLRQISGITFIDPVARLRELRATRPVFFKTDAHWTAPAAYEVGRTLVGEIARLEDVPSPWRHPPNFAPKVFSGGEALQLPLFVRPTEVAEGYVNDREQKLPVARVATDVAPWTYMHETAPGASGLLPCVAVVGDSFWMGVQVTGPQLYFRAFYQATWYQFADFKTLLDTPSDCKYFIYEFVQGNRLAIETLARFR
jgi:hypothetical protein